MNKKSLMEKDDTQVRQTSSEISPECLKVGVEIYITIFSYNFGNSSKKGRYKSQSYPVQKSFVTQKNWIRF